MSSYVTKDGIRYFDFVAHAALTLSSIEDCGGFESEGTRNRTKVYARYYREIGVWPLSTVLPRQAHTMRVRIVSPENMHTLFKNTDGLVSNHATISLALTVADCLPIYLAIPTHGIVALLHSGRRSTGILRKAVNLLRRTFHIFPHDIHLLFGPSISSCCYEVDQSIARAFQKNWGAESMTVRNGKYYLDLVAANRGIARALGITACDVIDECTCCNPAYHSYRRDGSGAYKRMIALVSLKA